MKCKNNTPTTNLLPLPTVFLKLAWTILIFAEVLSLVKIFSTLFPFRKPVNMCFLHSMSICENLFYFSYLFLVSSQFISWYLFWILKSAQHFSNNSSSSSVHVNSVLLFAGVIFENSCSCNKHIHTDFVFTLENFSIVSF